MTDAEGAALRRLACLWGVQTAYYDVERRRRSADEQALIAVLRALGAPVEGRRDLRDAVRGAAAEALTRALEPVSVVWGSRPASVRLRLPQAWAQGAAYCRLDLEGVGHRTWQVHLDHMPVTESVDVEGTRYITLALPLPQGLPAGYHQLSVDLGSKGYSSLVLSAPERAYAGRGRWWGVFLPLYALRHRGDWGVGDFTGLSQLAEWVRCLGGQTVATLPLLPTSGEGAGYPSPYAPLSRLFWNEAYIDVAAVPELSACPEAQEMVAAPDFQSEMDRVRRLSMVDYKAVRALKRRVLAQLSQWFWAHANGARRGALAAFLDQRPEVRDYARFRAAGEKLGVAWRSWPNAARDGTLSDGDIDVTSARYHMYVQWIAHEQLSSVAERLRQQGGGLYFDLPLGVHRDGYDTWRERAAYVEGVSVGAPPDTFFPLGQNWGFPPPHPRRIREQGYRYWRAALSHHLAVAATLRIDHVMGLHRLYWVPDGMPASQGVYVRYPAEEMYAVLCIESQRRQAMIVGEDLGTVPRAVTAALARRGILHSYVLQYEATPAGLRQPPAAAVASLNTHDMPPFAAFWQGLDIDERAASGLYSARETAQHRRRWAAIKDALLRQLREAGWLAEDAQGEREVMLASLQMLAASRSRLTLVNLEDLWLEREPQNVPGTGNERPNWRRRSRYRLEEMADLPEVVAALREVHRQRASGGGRV